MERKSHPHSFYSVRMDHNIFHKCHDFAHAAFWEGTKPGNDKQHHSIHEATNQPSPCGYMSMCSIASHTICDFCICQVTHSVCLHSKPKIITGFPNTDAPTVQRLGRSARRSYSFCFFVVIWKSSIIIYTLSRV